MVEWYAHRFTSEFWPHDSSEVLTKPHLYPPMFPYRVALCTGALSKVDGGGGAGIRPPPPLGVSPHVELPPPL